jgi:peptidoglycan/xylan/chitin deacetylase (PgdA/CDA1 family)
VRPAVIRSGLECLYVSGAHVAARAFFGGVGIILQFRHVRPMRWSDFQPNRHLEVSPVVLDRIVARLRRWNYDLVSLDEMHRRLRERDFARRFCVLTFDDGYRDTLEWAHPVLEKHEAPFAVYVPTSFPDGLGRLWWLALEKVVAHNASVGLVIDGDNRRFECATPAEKYELYDALYEWLLRHETEAEMLERVADLAARHGVDIPGLCASNCMGWREIAELAADPLVTIGAHTVNHPLLAIAGETAVRSELAMGASVLEAALGTRPRHLAYPFGGRGHVGTREFGIARDLGYSTAVTARQDIVRAVDADRLTALPRLSVLGGFTARRHLRVLTSGLASALWNRFPRIATT